MYFVFKLVLILLAILLGMLFLAFLFTQWQARQITQRYPNIGELIDVGGLKLNSVHVPRPKGADLPALVFIHGASGSLRDPMMAFLKPLEGRAEMLFVDRPGHGYSERGGAQNTTPAGQADAIAGLMENRGIKQAIIVAHSFGGAAAATFAMRHKDKLLGLVFLSPATHPWPGGLAWYYDIANTPYLGPLFCNTVSLPAGMMLLDAGVDQVFSPNPVPVRYSENAAIPLVLRPGNFCNNARDVANLLEYVKRIQPRYHEISVPTIIITGDSDDVVYEHLHAQGLKRDIAGSEYYKVRNLGHKPDYIATDLAIAAMEKVAGMPRDLQRIARDVERRIAAK